MNSLPFSSLLPFEGRVLWFEYEAFVPLCIEEVLDDLTSDSESDSDGPVVSVDDDEEAAEGEDDAPPVIEETEEGTEPPVEEPSAASLPLGAKFAGGADQILTYRSRFETFLNRAVDYSLVFTSQEHWSDGTGDFIAAGYWKGRAGMTDRPVIWSIPLCPDITPTTNWLTQVIAGTRDAEFATAAAALATFRASDTEIPIRIGWECNGSWYPWSPDFASNSVSAADYVSAFRRVVDIFRAASSRFVFDWNVNLKTSTLAATEALYPGDLWVDIISGDCYFNPTFDGTDSIAAFATLRDHATGLTWLAQFAATHGKRLAIDEYAAKANYGLWVDLMAQWLTQQDDLAWHCWWDSNAGNFPGTISDGLSGTTGERYLANFQA